MRLSVPLAFVLVIAILAIAPRSSAQIVNLAATIDVAQEVPAPTGASGSGSATLTLDQVTGLLSWEISWSGLTGDATAAHFHGPAGPGVVAGIEIVLADLTSPSVGSQILLAQQISDVLAGLWYINIHTAANPSGEIRGQVLETVLPVELSHFDVRLEEDGALLTWKTLSETNNAGFSVEQGVGSDMFAEIGYVEGHGTTNLPKDYSFAVSDLDPGLHRFRLKQIDWDGVFEYSFVVEAMVTVPERFMLEAAYPNPFNPATTLRFAVPDEQHVEVTLFNTTGQSIRTLFSGTVSANELQQLRVNGHGLTSGTYLIHFEGNGVTATEQIVLAK